MPGIIILAFYLIFQTSQNLGAPERESGRFNMQYLLDSDVIINYLRGKIKVERKIKEAELYISIITLGELVYGAYKSLNIQESLKTAEGFISDLSIKIIDVSKEVIYEFGAIKADLEEKGQRLEDFDILIAATAKANSLKLVTNNIKHFQRITGLEVT